MEIASLPKVECAILHRQFDLLDNDIVFDAIQKLAARLKFAPEVQLMDTSSDTVLHVHVGGHRVLVSQNSAPLRMSELQNTLMTPYANMVLPSAYDIVHSHKACTRVTIARGLFDQSNDAMLFQDTHPVSNSFNTDDEALRAMTFCRELVKLVIGHNPATAIYWQPSDNLVPQDFFERNCVGDMLLLNLRPLLLSSTGQIANDLPLGLELSGSQWIIGRLIEFEEAPVTFPWMMEAAIAFISLCQARGSILPHMEAFGLEGKNWRVGTAHEAGDRPDAWEKIKLVPVHVPEFGILDNADSQFTFKPENKATVRASEVAERHEIKAANQRLFNEPSTLNPDDMMDLAILEQLRKRQAAEDDGMTLPTPVVKTDEAPSVQAPPVVEESKPQTFQPAHEPWTGNAKKTDLESLRELARTALNEDGKGPDEHGKGSLFSKLGGMFGKR